MGKEMQAAEQELMMTLNHPCHTPVSAQVGSPEYSLIVSMLYNLQKYSVKIHPFCVGREILLFQAEIKQTVCPALWASITCWETASLDTVGN